MSFTFAGEFADTVIDSSGKPVRSTAITVKRAVDGVTATLYTDRTKDDEAANPVLSDSYGNLRFFADPGSYLLVAAGGPTGGVNVVVGVDPAEAVEDGGAATPNGPAGGALTGTYPNPTLAAGAVGTAALVDGGVTPAKLSFDPATQAELDAEAIARLEGDQGHVHQDLLLAKGDLIVGASAGVAARLPAGTTGHPLVADSTETLGVEFAQLGTDGIANGAVTAAKVGPDVATLGVDGKLTASQLPDLAISAFLGTTASQAAMLALVGQRGDWTVRTDTDPDTTWMLVADDPTQIGNWRQLSTVTDAVSSVNGRTGAVVGLAEAADVVPKSLYEANSVVVAVNDDTPVAQQLAFFRVLGRMGGNIAALTGGDLATLIGDPSGVTLTTTGKNGLSPRRFSGRKTTVGAPTTGTWAVDDEIMDSAGTIWRCTVAGTPGTWAQQSGTSALLATVAYNPTTPDVTYSKTGDTLQGDVDATNLAITFTAPSSGKVIVVLSAIARATGSFQWWNLRDGGGDVAAAGAERQFVSGTATQTRCTARFIVTGLTPGQAYTYRWGFGIGNAGNTANIYAGKVTPYGPATMEVWSGN